MYEQVCSDPFVSRKEMYNFDFEWLTFFSFFRIDSFYITCNAISPNRPQLNKKDMIAIFRSNNYKNEVFSFIIAFKLKS